MFEEYETVKAFCTFLADYFGGDAGLGTDPIEREKEWQKVGQEFLAKSANEDDHPICSYCKESKHTANVERYSAGCYAGRMCDDCAYSKYRDHCGVDGAPQLTQADCDEPIEPEAYYGSASDFREEF